MRTYKCLCNTSDSPIILTRSVPIDAEFESRNTDYSIESLKEAIQGADAVVHLAAKRGTTMDVNDYFQNAVITQNLYKSCADLGIKNIVFISSIAVYSDEKAIPWKEQDVTPKTVYGSIKLLCENIGNIYHDKFGLNIKSLRLGQVLGEGEVKGMMNTFIDRAYEKEELTVTGRSISKREFVYVKDVVDAVLLSLEKPQIHGSFNIGSNESYSNLEIAEAVNEVFDNIDNLSYDDSIPETIESSMMDSSFASRIIGYEPKWTLKEALKDIKISKQNIE